MPVHADQIALRAQPAQAPLPASLGTPMLSSWPALQARLVERIKRTALRHLHASRAGERLLLKLYVAGEESTEIALPLELLGQPPEWLARQVEQHVADERRHAAAFTAALNGYGTRQQAVAAAPSSSTPARPDVFMRRKIRLWRDLAHRRSAHFSAGLLVPAFAACLCAEQMATRLMQRHCSVIGASHPLYPLLADVLRDEERHIRLCQHTLTRLVTPSEQASLDALLAEIRTIERSWAVSGAIAMYLVGVALRFSPVRS